ncbi:SDR family oxidoreductase [Enterococcus olivae]
MSHQVYPLQNKRMFITGVSRKRGIGYAIAKKCAELGASLCIQHYEEHDARQEWGAESVEEVFTELKQSLIEGATFQTVHVNFEKDEEFEQLAAFFQHNGPIDFLVCNHALSGNDGKLEEITAEDLDRHWQVNTKSTILLTQLFAKQHDQSRGIGKVIFMISGQSLGPMPGEISYALAKGALAESVQTLAYSLSAQKITLNAVNPGVTNTGYLDEAKEWGENQQVFPFGRFSQPADAANLIAFLLSDEGSWITGQIINSEGGFRRIPFD